MASPRALRRETLSYPWLAPAPTVLPASLLPSRPPPAHSSIRLLCRKNENKDDDKKDEAADAADAKELEPSWLQRQKQMDRCACPPPPQGPCAVRSQPRR